MGCRGYCTLRPRPEMPAWVQDQGSSGIDLLAEAIHDREIVALVMTKLVSCLEQVDPPSWAIPKSDRACLCLVYRCEHPLELLRLPIKTSRHGVERERLRGAVSRTDTGKRRGHPV